MSALVRAFSNFTQALSNIVFAILNAFLAVFQAIVQLLKEVATGAFDILQAIVRLFTELLQDTVGFVFGESYLPSGCRPQELTTGLQRTFSCCSASVEDIICIPTIPPTRGARESDEHRGPSCEDAIDRCECGGLN